MRLGIGTVGLLLLGACSSSSPSPKADPVALVGVSPVAEGPIAETVTIYGAAESGTSGRNDLSAPIEAILVAIDAAVGARVARGQVVARLAPSPAARLDLVRAASDARQTTDALARAQRLRADGLVSDAEVQAARAAARSATAMRDSLGARGNALILRASASGTVQSIAPSIGDVIPAGGVVATIARAGDLRARFGIDPGLARRLDGALRLRIVPSGGGAPFSALVLSVDPVVDPQTRLASVYTLIPSQWDIGAGESLTAQVQLSAPVTALTIPYAALLDEGGQAFVYVIEKNVAKRRDVIVGAAESERVAILSGLKNGDAVVIAGGTALEDGMKVRTK